MGSPVTLGVQLDPLGGGPPDVAGEGMGEGPVELVGAVGEEPPHATANKLRAAIMLRI